MPQAPKNASGGCRVQEATKKHYFRKIVNLDDKGVYMKNILSFFHGVWDDHRSHTPAVSTGVDRPCSPPFRPRVHCQSISRASDLISEHVAVAVLSSWFPWEVGHGGSSVERSRVVHARYQSV